MLCFSVHRHLFNCLCYFFVTESSLSESQCECVLSCGGCLTDADFGPVLLVGGHLDVLAAGALVTVPQQQPGTAERHY